MKSRPGAAVVSLPIEPWMTAPAVSTIFDAIAAEGAVARFVGGAVRNRVMGLPITDIDIATDMLPDRVMNLLHSRDIKVVPTGIEHGTITAVVDGEPYEVTTLRRDVETDGRRAVVAFTNDWREDALRRDFTMNALSMGQDGAVYDYFGGLEDAVARRVRFVGDADLRIREDVLRILRFFRLQAQYGQGEPDPIALDSCRRLATLLPNLSAERVWTELAKLLSVPDPGPVFELGLSAGAFSHWLPETSAASESLRSAVSTFQTGAEPPDQLDIVARLSIVAGLALSGSVPCADRIAERLRLSSRERDHLALLVNPPLRPNQSPTETRTALYELGWDRAMAVCRVGLALDAGRWSGVSEVANRWEDPVFPVTGGDVVSMGVEPGPRVGAILENVRRWWISEACLPNRAACLRRLKETQ